QPTAEAIRSALNEHKALVFKNTGLDATGQEQFARAFGELTISHPTLPGAEGAPNVLPVDSEDGTANQWHTDVTFVVNPPQASTLRSEPDKPVPSYGGETLIANTAAGYADLPDPLRDLADTLFAVHTNDYDYAVPAKLHTENAERRAQFRSVKFQTAHPVVRV